MRKESAATLNPAALPVGTVVGPWRVVDWAAQGVHGAVYRVVQVDKELAPPVALKLALHPRDPRFAREAELLSRLRHPSIPRLWDSGEWLHPSGALYPYFVTEWVEGTTLYAAAEQHPPSPQQVLRWLGQLARALQAVHSLGAVHRDVKGANVLVCLSDKLVFLADFGSGTYPEAATLTPPGLCLGTPAYRAPEVGLFELHSIRDPSARHGARPAEDLYALGVTACRLVTGEYPEFADPWKDPQGLWHLDSVKVPEALLRVEPALRDLILRMLSVRPEDRGSAAELAEALEKAARLPALPPPEASPASEEPVIAPARRSWLATATVGLGFLALAGGAWVSLWEQGGADFKKQAAAVEAADAGTTALGEAAASTAPRDAPVLAAQEALSEDTPPKPVEGQVRPDANGRCPRKQQVALNGGCWAQPAFEREECEATGGSMFKGGCYLPILSSKHVPTTSPTK